MKNYSIIEQNDPKMLNFWYTCITLCLNQMLAICKVTKMFEYQEFKP